MIIGVLAVQGAFAEHITTLNRLNVEAMPVRLPKELERVDGLVIPGGESTAVSRLMTAYGLVDIVKNLAKNGMALFGTCTGMILMSTGVSNNGVISLGLMNVKVKRNAFGRQKESFETELAIPALGNEPFPAVFIRAPIIEEAGGDVEILARLDNGKIVAARQGKMLAAAFHPELTDDLRFHQYFLDIVKGKQGN
jgi:5'-phosphate synthase pdxT subunit